MRCSNKKNKIMLKKTIIAITFIVAFVSAGHSQSIENLKDINKVWDKFCQGFNALDHKLFAEVHSKELIRIAGGNTFFDYQTYISNYKKQFQTFEANNTTNNISP